ncbi:MAG: hypothetical protein FVQ81_09820 [Candidatus Glassbacteria bacterium]|nr:hypothetical protein [Candidatus Glassbacteria bacterium]
MRVRVRKKHLLSAGIQALIFFLCSSPLRALERVSSTSDTLAPAVSGRVLQLSHKYVVASSLELLCRGHPLPDSLYRLESVPGRLILLFPLPCDTLVVNYSLLNGLSLPDSFSLRKNFPPPELDGFLAERPVDSTKNATVKNFGGSDPGEGFRLAGFNISGSKSVSVSGGGGAPGTALDQNLMLQISGKLGRDTELSFRLNDQDLSLSSDGRSAELRELDEVAVSLNSPGAGVTLGDYDFSLTGFQFARIERKLDGVQGRLERGPVELKAGAALGGGTFRSVQLNGTEGRQGPYQLSGTSGEPVRVLVGTERVYLDGRRLSRGVRADYTIDYTRGTITFTERHLIGTESRIEIDYEYSSFTFRKSLYNVTARVAGQAGELRAYFVRESDLEDSPPGGLFSPEELDWLDSAGTGLDSILTPGVRFLGDGRGSYVMLFDSSGKPYFRYTGPGGGDYMVSFNRVGLPLGSYEFDAASGGYTWVGAGNGQYEPAGEVTPPSRDDRAGLAFAATPLPRLSIEGEGAVLKRTLNLFTARRAPARSAHRISVRLDTLALGALPARLSIDAGQRGVQRDFSFAGRRYQADFERNWNLLPLASGGNTRNTPGENLAEAGARLDLPAGLAIESGWGRLSRTSGERASRRTWGVALKPSEALSAAWRRLDIDTRRLPSDTTAGTGLFNSYRRRDNGSLALALGRTNSSFGVEREERTSPDLGFGITGSRHLELTGRLNTELSPRLELGLSLLGRDTDEQAAGTALWSGATRARAVQLETSWNGPGALRVRGRLGHRRQQYVRGNLGRTSSTAGRVEVFGGGFAGRWQSHVVYELSHGSSLRNRAVYLPERYPDDGAYLEDGTYVGAEQGTHRREVLPAEIDPRQTASLKFTARQNLDLTEWVDSARTVISRMAWSATARLERESTLSEKWKLYLMLPSALNDDQNSLLAQTWINTDLTVQWKKPAVFSRLELVWNTNLDRRFESGSEEFADRKLRLQLRVPLAEGVEWSPTAELGRLRRLQLSGGRSRVSSLRLDNGFVVNLGEQWRAGADLDLGRFEVEGESESYRRFGAGGSLTRFLGGSGRIEAGLRVSRLSGPGSLDVMLVEVLGSARPGTSYRATAAVSVEPGERMMLHFRYTGRTDYLLNDFTHYGRAELKYFF